MESDTNMTTECNTRLVKVGSLKAANSVNVELDRRALYTVGQVIEMAGFAVPEIVRVESGVISATDLLPDSVRMIAIGLTNVKAGAWNDDDDYEDDDDDDEDDENDYEYGEISPIQSPQSTPDIPAEHRRCIKVGSLKAANSITISLDKRKLYTIGQVIEMAGFAVPEIVRVETGAIESGSLLPDSVRMIAIGLTNVKAGSR